MATKKTFERETVDGFLSRGGVVTTVPTNLAGDLQRLDDAELVEVLLGASYDDALTRNATPWFVADDVLSTIDEEYANRDYDTGFED